MRASRLSTLLEPVYQAIAVLAALAFLVCYQNGAFVQDEWMHLLQLALYGGVLFAALRYFTGQDKAPESLIVTVLLIFLLVDPNPNPWALTAQTLAMLAVVTVAVASKFFLEIDGEPIVNPAALGVLFGAFLGVLLPGITIVGDAARLSFDTLFSVGGISISWVALLLAVWIFWGLPKWERTAVISAFFIASAAFAFVLGGGAAVEEFFTAGPWLYLFAGFFITDPKTSPDDHLWQWGYGAVLALLVFLPQVIPAIAIPFLEDNLFLVALAIANIGLLITQAWALRR